MLDRLTSASVTVAIATTAVGVTGSVSTRRATDQAPASSVTAPVPALKTPWGEPDLQGIWTDEFDTSLQRPAKYGEQAFFTQAQRAELDKERTEMLNRRAAGTLADAYNFAVFLSTKRTGVRTSKIVGPPNGRIPPLTGDAQKAAAADREFRLILLQATDTCKKMAPGCTGGKYDPTPSPRRADAPPRYNIAGINRYDGPEDGTLANRCLTPGLPEFGGATGSFRRIVQTPGGISIFYDVGQGQGWQRNIVMDGSPHLSANIRQWYGDSRGHWEGNTLVIDVTNFSPKTDFQGSREKLHLIERWTRTGPATLEYVVTIEDPTVWTKAWTVKQEFTKQSDEENRIYSEPRCLEGNYGLPGLLHGRRVEDAAFAEGRGPDPALTDNTNGGVLTQAEVPQDPLQQ